METEFEYGDVVDCAICNPPMEIIIIGALHGPEEYGTIYIGSNPKTFGMAIKGHYLTKTGVNMKKADDYCEDYMIKYPNKLKDLSD